MFGLAPHRSLAGNTRTPDKTDWQQTATKGIRVVVANEFLLQLSGFCLRKLTTRQHRGDSEETLIAIISESPRCTITQHIICNLLSGNMFVAPCTFRNRILTHVVPNLTKLDIAKADLPSGMITLHND